MRLTGEWWIVIVVPSTALMLLAAGRVSWFSCPNCHKCFGMDRGVWIGQSQSNLLRRKCLHCGIKIGTRKGSP
jgi:hypothetical protein